MFNRFELKEAMRRSLLWLAISSGISIFGILIWRVMGRCGLTFRGNLILQSPDPNALTDSLLSSVLRTVPKVIHRKQLFSGNGEFQKLHDPPIQSAIRSGQIPLSDRH